ncbi:MULTISPECIES: hypothetical protein [Bacteria]|uniref:hypothetical protein n=1 Tax=Bacteria TaxID=2 RepID=UPI003404DCE2
MTLKEIQLKNQNAESIIKLFQSGMLNITKKDHKDLLKQFATSLTDGRYIQSRNMLFICLGYDIDVTLNFIKSKGVFRYSSFIGQKCIVESIVNEAIGFLEMQSPTASEALNYFTSISNFSFIHKHFNELNSGIHNEIRNFKKKYPKSSLFKTLIAFVEFQFLIDYMPDNEDEDRLSYQSRTKEDFCSAVSYLTFLINSIKPLRKEDVRFAAPEFITNNEIEPIISLACQLEDYKEIEILIDNFGYLLVREQNGVLRLCPQSVDFEKSMRLGYIRHDLQALNDAMLLLKDPVFETAESIDKLSDMMLENFPESTLQYTDTHNYPRYVLGLPDGEPRDIINNYLSQDALFQEEVYHLNKIFKEQLFGEDALQKVLKGSITLMEFIKIRRILVMMEQMMKKALFKLEGAKTADIIRSMVPIFDEQFLYKVLDGILTDDKVEDFLDLLIWEPQMKGVFDIQYHNFIFIDGVFVLPISVFSHSNTIRNLYASQYKRNNTNLLSDGSVDALTEDLSEALGEVGLECTKGVVYGTSEVDLAFLLDDLLVLVECKHTLLPTSVHELRTTYDYIQKAQLQLDKAIISFKNGELRRKLSERFGKALPPEIKIRTMVVTSNRLLNGNLYQHPVRNIHEVNNLVKSGIMRTNEGDFCLWTGKRFSALDLELYLDEKIIHYQHIYNSLKSFVQRYQTAQETILYESYFINMKEATDSLSEIVKDLPQI